MNCSVAGCTGTVIARGWCRTHYQRWRRHGDPHVKLNGRGEHPDDRLQSNVALAADGCLLWTGWSIPVSGYGVLSIDGKNVLVHRLAWERANGPIPEGLVVDHACHNIAAAAGLCSGGVACTHRRCVNLEHLRLVTPAENNAASPLSPTTRNAKKTSCVRGHRLPASVAGQNRVCLACRRERYRMMKEAVQ